MKKNPQIKTDVNQLEEISGMTPEFPFVKHYTDYSKNSVPWHWHVEFELKLVNTGHLVVHTTAGDYSFEKGEAYFMNSNVLASMEGDEDCTEDAFLFHSIMLSGHFKSVFETKYILPVINNRRLEIVELRGETEEEKRIISRLRSISKLADEDDTEFLVRNELSLIWMDLLKVIENTSPKAAKSANVKSDRLMTMMAYIHSNFAEKISLEELAEAGAVSKREALRCFQNGIHKSPFEYLKEYRIMKAKEMLSDPDLSVTQIAFSTGFSSGAYFTKTFRECTKMTPGQYRAGLH